MYLQGTLSSRYLQGTFLSRYLNGIFSCCVLKFSMLGTGKNQKAHLKPKRHCFGQQPQMKNTINRYVNLIASPKRCSWDNPLIHVIPYHHRRGQGGQFKTLSGHLSANNAKIRFSSKGQRERPVDVPRGDSDRPENPFRDKCGVVLQATRRSRDLFQALSKRGLRHGPAYQYGKGCMDNHGATGNKRDVT